MNNFIDKCIRNEQLTPSEVGRDETPKKGTVVLETGSCSTQMNRLDWISSLKQTLLSHDLSAEIILTEYMHIKKYHYSLLRCTIVMCFDYCIKDCKV